MKVLKLYDKIRKTLVHKTQDKNTNVADVCFFLRAYERFFKPRETTNFGDHSLDTRTELHRIAIRNESNG